MGEPEGRHESSRQVRAQRGEARLVAHTELKLRSLAGCHDEHSVERDRNEVVAPTYGQREVIVHCRSGGRAAETA